VKKTKKQKPPSKFTAIVRTTYGSGKKKKIIENEVVVDFKTDYIYNTNVAETAISKILNHTLIKDECVNEKALQEAYDKWMAGDDAALEERRAGLIRNEE
jgi:hypothetical protein